jgi:hypothetical protein
MPDPIQVNIGGTFCFAPPMTDEKLDRYEELADSEGGETGAVMRELLACVRAWWKLPESRRTDGRRLRLQDAEVVETPLEPDHVKELDPVTPWMRELNTLSTEKNDGPLDSLPPGEVRDAAFHLLWYAKEITQDREPLTRDKLPEPKATPPARTTPRRK